MQDPVGLDNNNSKNSHNNALDRGIEHCGRPRRSRFTYRHLAQLAASNTASPLRVIAHIDLDAFYAQCEMVRLGIPEDQPLAVQQWQALIAINYPARKWGIGRHCNVAEAKKMCPDLIAQHVATWREGDEKWAYRDDAAAPAHMATDKVSLDPYRLQSRKILSLVKECLPRELQRVEKASIDEVFLDLSAQVHAEMLRRFPVLEGPPPYGDVSEMLPFPPLAALDWQADFVAGSEEETRPKEEEKEMDPDWDDVAIWIGSEIVRHVRAQVRQQLGYTCSAGLASNKLLSKLASAFKKPNCQTIVRARAVEGFLANTKISKMRNLGGKLGEQVISLFGTDNVKELLEISLEQMKIKLGDDTGLWVYNTIRGIDHSEVNSRTQIKSMLSAKSFRPPISTPEQAVRWLRIFVGDIFSRLLEEGILENKRRPRTINLHHRHAGQMKSRQAPIPSGKALDEELLFSLAKHLLQLIISEGSVWPCANLSLSVGSFEDGVKGNMGIGAFLIKGEEAASLKSIPPSPDPDNRPTETGQPKKRLRSDDEGIERFFAKKPASDRMQPTSTKLEYSAYVGSNGDDEPDHTFSNDAQANGQDNTLRRIPNDKLLSWPVDDDPRTADLRCSKCDACFDDSASLQSHEDWHYATSLQDEERVRSTLARPSGSGPSHQSQPQRTPGASSKRGKAGAKREQGQSKLKFG